MSDYDGTAHDHETSADRLTAREVALRVAYRNVRDAIMALDDVIEDDDLLDFLDWADHNLISGAREVLGSARGNLSRRGGSRRR